MVQREMPRDISYIFERLIDVNRKYFRHTRQFLRIHVCTLSKMLRTIFWSLGVAVLALLLTFLFSKVSQQRVVKMPRIWVCLKN